MPNPTEAKRILEAALLASPEPVSLADLKRLFALQQDDGSWGFDLGTTSDEGKTWIRMIEPG